LHPIYPENFFLLSEEMNARSGIFGNMHAYPKTDMLSQYGWITDLCPFDIVFPMPPLMGPIWKKDQHNPGSNHSLC